jgi:hypothetical protein
MLDGLVDTSFTLCLKIVPKLLVVSCTDTMFVRFKKFAPSTAFEPHTALRKLNIMIQETYHTQRLPMQLLQV